MWKGKRGNGWPLSFVAIKKLIVRGRGGEHMAYVTYDVLIQYTIMITGIIALVLTFKDKHKK